RLAVKVVGPGPTEEDVARRLREALAFDDPLGVTRQRASAQERLQHRGICLLQLKEQWILVVSAEQKQDPAPRADAADSDDLPREVAGAEALQQQPALGEQRAAVAAEDGPQLLLAAVGLVLELGERYDQRRVRDDSRLAVDQAGQLRQRPNAVARVCVGLGPLDRLHPSA